MDKRVEHIRDLIRKGKSKEAIDRLLGLVKTEQRLAKYQNDITSLSARYYDFQRDEIGGTLRQDEKEVLKNKLNKNILDLTISISITLENRDKSLLRGSKNSLGYGLIIRPLIILSLLIGIGGFIYYKTFSKLENENIIIFGKVYDSTENNSPLKNARVEIVDLLGVFSFTDNNGAFEFEFDKPEKKYLEFQVTCDTYETQNFNIAIKPNKNNEQSLEKFLLKRIAIKEEQDRIVIPKEQEIKRGDSDTGKGDEGFKFTNEEKTESIPTPPPKEIFFSIEPKNQYLIKLIEEQTDIKYSISSSKYHVKITDNGEFTPTNKSATLFQYSGGKIEVIVNDTSCHVFNSLEITQTMPQGNPKLQLKEINQAKRDKIINDNIQDIGNQIILCLQ